MTRPATFQNPHIALQNLPYSSVNGSASEAPTLGGVLCCGQIVWTAEPFTMSQRPRSALAFVEGIGTVRIDPRWITTAARTSREIASTPALLAH
jgi:hypothetical protein